MRAETLLFLALAIILSLIFGQVFLAILLFIALAVILVFFGLSKTAKAAKETGDSLSKGIMTDLEKAKGQSPKGSAEIGKILETAGAKTAEWGWAKNKETYKSTDLLGRIGQGSKNLLEGLGRLFK